MPLCSISDVQAALGFTSVPNQSDERMLERALDGSAAAIEKFLGYCPVQATYTDALLPCQEKFVNTARDGHWNSNGQQAFWDGDAGEGEKLFIPNIPLRSITSLYEDRTARAGAGPSAFPASSELTEGDDFYIDADSDGGISLSGIIYRVGFGWPTRARTVKLTYVAGYSEAELAGTADGVNAALLREAAIDEAARRYRQMKNNAQLASGKISAGTKVSERLGDYAYTTSNSSESDNQASNALHQSLANATIEKLQEFMYYGLMQV